MAFMISASPSSLVIVYSYLMFPPKVTTPYPRSHHGNNCKNQGDSHAVQNCRVEAKEGKN